MKLLLSLMLLMNFNTSAVERAKAGQDKGNGGSGKEALLVAQQAQIENVAQKIRSFFLKNESTLKPVFKEIAIQKLLKKIKESDIRVVDEDKLIDRHGISRTCLNFVGSSLIECKSSGIAKLFDQPAAFFVLVLHEYLGLIGVEETAPNNPTYIDGYKISKKIAPYVSKVSNYDLSILEVINTENSTTPSGLTDFSNISSSNYLKVKSNFDRAQIVDENDFNSARFSGRCLFRFSETFEHDPIPSLLILQKSANEISDPVFGKETQLEMQVFDLGNEKSNYFDLFTSMMVDQLIEDHVKWYKMNFLKVFFEQSAAVVKYNNNPAKKTVMVIRKLDGVYYVEKPTSGYVCYYFKKVN